MRTVLVGGDGFVGRHLILRLHELRCSPVRELGVRATEAEVAGAIAEPAIFLLLAELSERERDEAVALQRNLVQRLARSAAARGSVIALADRVGADGLPEPGRAWDEAAHDLTAGGAVVHQRRLEQVFGKWSDPRHGSIVATLCARAAAGMPIERRDEDVRIRLQYVDDVVDDLIGVVDGSDAAPATVEVAPVYDVTVGALQTLVAEFAESRSTLAVPDAGSGLARALYATYLSYLEPTAFAYPLTAKADARGAFVEVLKTRAAGQVAYFTAGPGTTRGGHYHHTKTEKFVVVRGTARFRFRHIETGATHSLIVDERVPTVVETVPGWAHDITNVGEGELAVLLWASEVYDPSRPDTIPAPVTE
jgi:UDP-2-acetamido-2,6-beta-L-arabino-hexul-4-ose reductase